MIVLLGVNSPVSFMPRLPIHLTQGGHSHGQGPPPGVRLSPQVPPHHHRSPLHVSGHQHLSSDSKILPPHAIRRLTRPAPNILHPDDE